MTRPTPNLNETHEFVPCDECSKTETGKYCAPCAHNNGLIFVLKDKLNEARMAAVRLTTDAVVLRAQLNATHLAFKNAMEGEVSATFAKMQRKAED